jgi:uncharacterized protein involved in exopolysaccharide biosynthesis
LPGLPAAKRKQSKSPKRNKSNLPDVRSETKPDREISSASFRTLGAALFRHRRFVVCLVGGLSAACVLYCLIAPKEFEAGAKIALRSSPATALSVDGANGANSTAFASDQTQLETLADVFRSDQLAWGVIGDQTLYLARGFAEGLKRDFMLQLWDPMHRPICWSDFGSA